MAEGFNCWVIDQASCAQHSSFYRTRTSWTWSGHWVRAAAPAGPLYSDETLTVWLWKCKSVSPQRQAKTTPDVHRLPANSSSRKCQCGQTQFFLARASPHRPPSCPQGCRGASVLEGGQVPGVVRPAARLRRPYQNRLDSHPRPSQESKDGSHTGRKSEPYLFCWWK